MEITSINPIPLQSQLLYEIKYWDPFHRQFMSTESKCNGHYLAFIWKIKIKYPANSTSIVLMELKLNQNHLIENICEMCSWDEARIIPLILTSTLGWAHKLACLPWHLQSMTRLPTWPQKALISWGRVINCLHQGTLKQPWKSAIKMCSAGLQKWTWK